MLVVDISAVSVVGSPVLDRRLRFLQCVEDLAIEQLIAQFAFEALAITILPRTARLDVSSSGSDSGDPSLERLGGKLREVVETYVRRNVPRDERLAQGSRRGILRARRCGD